jgi:hypothetical protein
MKYFKLYEEFGTYLPTPFDSPKITNFSQQTPNGLGGSYDNTMNWKKIDSPLDNEFKRFSRDFSQDKKFIKKSRKKNNKKIKHIRTNISNNII